MKLYDKNLIIYLLEARLLEAYDDYYPQGQYNNKFITYLYRYIRENTYVGEHDELLRQLIKMKSDNEKLFKNTKIEEKSNRRTYVITDETGISQEMKNKIAEILYEYHNYKYDILSENRIEFTVGFGWLPQNTASWLNLINDEDIIDYYIDDITLRPNTHSMAGGRPDSGYVCYLIKNVQEYDTLMFLANKDLMEIENISIPKFKIASILTDIRGTKGATLNRIVDFDLCNFFYEVGPYNRNYISTTKTSLIIQVPYDYAVGDYYYLYDVSNSVKIGNNNADANHQDNYFVSFDNENFKSMFSKFRLKNVDRLVNKIFSETDKLSESLIQFLFGDFIWKTSDSKLIAYSQNLINYLYGNAQLTANGVWSDSLSNLITRYKTGNIESYFDDDVIDKTTEEAMIAQYKRGTNLDPNEQLFNEW